MCDVDVKKMDLFTYLMDVEGFSYDEAVETCIRYETGFDYPDVIREMVRRWINITSA